MRTYYHNITREILNESSFLDFIESYKDGDVCYKSVDGNACIDKVTKEDIRDIRNRYKEYTEDQKENRKILDSFFNDLDSGASKEYLSRYF